MKLNWLLVGVVMLAVTAGRASAQTFNLGLEAGANNTHFYGDGSAILADGGTAPKWGFVGGGFICLNFGKSIAVRPEILYEQKGVSIQGAGTAVELDYVEVPLLLKLSLGTPALNPAFFAGPTIGLKMLAQRGGQDLTDINSTDIGMAAGLELDIDKFLVSVRVELGLGDIKNYSNVRNGTFTFLAGYAFM